MPSRIFLLTPNRLIISINEQMTIPAGRRSVFHSAVPLHYQIQRLLRSKIEGGEWVSGERIPTEVELIARFRVSRATLRAALGALERDGLIVRHRRRGTFVRDMRPSTRSGGIITNLVLGYKAEVRLVSSETVPAPPHVVSFLGIARGQSVQRFVRVEIVENSPLAVVVNYMPQPLGRRISERDLARASMLEILREKLRIRLGRVRQQLEARMPDEEIATLLEIDVTQPVLLLRLLVSDKSRRPVEVADAFYRGDRYRYELTMPAVPRRVVARRPPPVAKGTIGMTTEAFDSKGGFL